jgi:hypothetical protein
MVQIAEANRTYDVQIDMLVRPDDSLGVVIYDDQKITASDGVPVLWGDLQAVAAALRDWSLDGGYFVQFSSQLDRTRSLEYPPQSGATLLAAWGHNA